MSRPPLWRPPLRSSQRSPPSEPLAKTLYRACDYSVTEITRNSREHSHANRTVPLRAIHDLDGGQCGIRCLAYLMMMTVDHISGTSRGHWPWFAAVVVLAGAAAAGLWHRAPSDSGSARGPPSAIQVTVAQAKTQDVPIYLSAPGTVQAWNTVAVRSQIDGKLTAVNFVEGQDVRAGDALAQIDTSALQATLDQAIAKKAEDEAQLAAAEKDLERDQVLVQRQAIPQQTLDQQQARWASSRSRWTPIRPPLPARGSNPAMPRLQLRPTAG